MILETRRTTGNDAGFNVIRKAEHRSLFYQLLSVLLLTFLGAFIFQQRANAQEINSWQAYTSYSTVNGIENEGEGIIWATTTGGVFVYNQEEIVHKITTLDGLSNLEATAIAYDQKRDRIILGYLDGTIDLIKTETLAIQSQNDIARADRFSPRGINDFVLKGDTLFVATDFGVVLYDLSSNLVQSTYVKLGRFNSAINVEDIFLADQRLYCATREGVAIGDLNQELTQPEQWMNHDNQNGFVNETVHSLAVLQDTLYATTSSDNYIYDGQQWKVSSQFGDQPIIEWETVNNQIYGISDRGIYSNETEPEERIRLPKNTIVRSFLYTENDNNFWIASGSQGLIRGSSSGNDYSFFKPDGPWLNFFHEVHSSGDALLATSELAFPSASPFANEKGYYLFRNGAWENYNTFTNSTLRTQRFSRVFTSAATEDHFYLGSWGDGIARHNRTTDSIRVYNADNSNLRGLGGDFVVAAGLDTDSNQDVWATSYLADRPLYYMEKGSNEWIGLPKYSFLSTSDHYFNLFIDSFDQQWISLLSRENNGRGLLVVDPGEDPTDISDDQAVKLTENADNGNLPDAKVQVIREDKEGEIWIGTARGVARYIIPERVIRGGSSDRRAQWLINADTTAESPFLLRDVNATSMAVNAANQKWIGSSGNGVWLVNEDGSRILEHYTKQNSPLLGNQVNSITIDSESGTVYFSTEQGLVSYTDVPKAAVQEMQQLEIFPNPYSYERHNDGVVIDNLSDKTTIRILSIDGQLIDKLDASGGRVRWDATDGRGQKVATGIYLIVALGEEGDKAIGKIAIIH